MDIRNIDYKKVRADLRRKLVKANTAAERSEIRYQLDLVNRELQSK